MDLVSVIVIIIIIIILFIIIIMFMNIIIIFIVNAHTIIIIVIFITNIIFIIIIIRKKMISFTPSKRPKTKSEFCHKHHNEIRTTCFFDITTYVYLLWYTLENQ